MYFKLILKYLIKLSIK